MSYTMKQLCEFIERSGIVPEKTAEEIFHCSTTGELSKIWDLFFMALSYVHNMPDREFTVEDSHLIAEFLGLKFRVGGVK